MARIDDSGRNCDGVVHALVLGMIQPYDEIEGLTERVIGCAVEVHRNLGPGLLESIYRECLLYELTANGIRTEIEKPIPINYKGRIVAAALRIDILVERLVVVEVKSIEVIHPIHLAQVITYLKLTGNPAGLLLNFNAVTLRAGLRRLDHPERYSKRIRMT